MRENTFINPFKKFSGDITELEGDFPANLHALLDSNRIHVKRGGFQLDEMWSVVDWGKYPEHFSIFYGFDNSEAIIKDCFKKSQLARYPSVIMDFGYSRALSKIPTSLFFDYWYEFLVLANYTSVVLTENGQCFMEFFEKAWRLKSNFEIQSDLITTGIEK